MDMDDLTMLRVTVLIWSLMMANASALPFYNLIYRRILRDRTIFELSLMNSIVFSNREMVSTGLILKQHRPCLTASCTNFHITGPTLFGICKDLVLNLQLLEYLSGPHIVL